MTKESYAKDIFISALNKLNINATDRLKFETPKNPDHGDFSSNIAMQLAKELQDNPRNIANKIIENIEYDKSIVTNLEIAGAGFINIKFSNNFYFDALKAIVSQNENYGKQEIGKGKSVNVEYVSANPTGLLHLGHGRNAAIGDTVANLYEWLGYAVTREYYFNNAGNQMNTLAKSIFARYMQVLGKTDFPFPEDGYHGDYIRLIAEEIFAKEGKKYFTGSASDLEILKKYGEVWNFDKIKKTLKRMNIHQDVFYNEDTLYTEGKIDAVIAEFKEKGLAYELDGALWLKLSELGQEKDKVIVKSTGEPTYRLPDIAYHKEKILRNYDIIIDIFGADHIATVTDVFAGVKALGLDASKLKVLIYQFVTLTENGEQVKMSKRTGKSYTLDELLTEVGEDVVRFFFIMRGISTHLEFDLAIAKEQSDKNPVFYLQYAHARICSVIDNAIEKGIVINNNADLTLLSTNAELNLIKELMRFPDIIKIAADKYEPHLIADYLRDVATAFHVFYHECRIIGIENDLMQSRFALVKSVRTVIKNGLTILGISAPERMFN
ncbi:MAG: arginine--tRNA ligase [Candidatus Kapabacteria bacterium]|nr:arginine--tRNA ligase [Candidatus Kapabacteria bacterium]